MKWPGLMALAALMLGLCACSGAKGMVKLESLKYPISTTAYLYGPDYKVLGPEQGLEKVGKLRHTARLWSIFWGHMKLSGNKEIGRKLNARIEKANGQGVINLSIRASSCGTNDFYQYTWNILNIIPFMPGCVKVRLEGDIVRQAMAARAGTAGPEGAGAGQSDTR